MLLVTDRAHDLQMQAMGGNAIPNHVNIVADVKLGVELTVTEGSVITVAGRAVLQTIGDALLEVASVISVD